MVIAKQNHRSARHYHRSSSQNGRQLIPALPQPVLRMYSWILFFQPICFMESLPFQALFRHYATIPNSFNGQIRKINLPTICSSETQPTWLLRESLETLR